MKITRIPGRVVLPDAADTVLRFEGFVLDLSERVLRRQGHAVELRPKSFDALACLALHAGQVMTKDELMAQVWPGLVVTDESLTRCISDIRAALGDGGHRLIKTVPRRGYVLAVQAQPSPFVRPRSRRIPTVGAALVLATIMVVLVAGAVWRGAGRRDAAPAPSIVVMPLGSRNGDPAQDYLAEAVTEEITVDLSRIPGSFVIGRSTADRYRGVDARRVGRELGVRYVLEGGLYRVGDRVHLHLQLVDAPSGRTLWAERFDGELRDLAALHRRVTGTIAQSLQVRMLEAESERSQSRRASDAQAQDLALRAWSLLRRRSREDITSARELLQQAVAREPSSAFAWALLAESYAADVGGRTPDVVRTGATRAEWLRRGEQASARAFSLDTNHPAVLSARTWILILQGRAEEALPLIERHLQINRNDATAWFRLCHALATLGRQDEAIGSCAQAIALSPRDASLANFHVVTAAAHLHLGHDADALASARRSAAVQPNFPVAHAWVASAAANLGDLDAAHVALAEFRRMVPDYTISSFRDERLCANAICERQRERFYAGLRRAGLAE
jgi:TolB-like protein/DNA-binding winged helix-turn-helix (wHTH) protein